MEKYHPETNQKDFIETYNPDTRSTELLYHQGTDKEFRVYYWPQMHININNIKNKLLLHLFHSSKFLTPFNSIHVYINIKR